MISLRPASLLDWPAVEALLGASALPRDGAREHLHHYVVATDDDVIVGTGGLEIHGDVALLRSLAVSHAYRDRGVGHSLVAELISNAERRRLTALYLLTTTATDYFIALGFAHTPRAMAPGALEASAEFQGACPASAMLMSLALPRRQQPVGRIRPATLADAESIAAIYAPIVRDTAISFELEAPTADEMRTRIAKTSATHPWLVSVDEHDVVRGYAYAGKHRERAAYQWSVDTTAYVGEECRGQGLGKALYEALFAELIRLGYHQAFAGIALPNDASVALHASVGFQPVGVYRRVGFKFGAWRDVGWWQRELMASRSGEVPKPVHAP